MQFKRKTFAIRLESLFTDNIFKLAIVLAKYALYSSVTSRRNKWRWDYFLEFCWKDKIFNRNAWLIYNKAVESLDTIWWNGILLDDFLPNWMIFFHLSSTWMSDLYITKSCIFCWYTTAEKRKSLNHVDFYLKLRFLIKSSYYIVPSPSTALI